MIEIGDKIISKEIFEKEFVCDLRSCKGACCVEGDSGAPLLKSEIKELQKVDVIFLSSIFKKNKNYLGLQKFLKLSSLSKYNIVALGGVSRKNKNNLKMINAWGFAGISYFQ